MRSLLLIFSFLSLISCSTHSNQASQNSSASNPREYQVGAYLWLQTSAEYRALVYQAYNIARERVERDLEDKHYTKRAVILDIDETLLDNSVGGAQDIRSVVIG
jgi:5'-nucleotidase (lipoprotein e(P4) family)